MDNWLTPLGVSRIFIGLGKSGPSGGRFLRGPFTNSGIRVVSRRNFQSYPSSFGDEGKTDNPTSCEDPNCFELH